MAGQHRDDRPVVTGIRWLVVIPLGLALWGVIIGAAFGAIALVRWAL